uniref:Uncharacterized protein n=1 Tax=Solanum lycopersicum TaxID=4081 RepID=A0A3Q7FAP9_SOLLC
MITEMLSISTIGKAPPPRTNFSPSNGKPPRASCFICCVRKNAESNGSSSGPLQLEICHEVSSMKNTIPSCEKQPHEPTIRGAISFNSSNNNNRRLMSDNFSISAELLLRIDSMVLTSLIGSKEASEFRRLVMDSIDSIADYFSQIMHKQDTELLVELRHFPQEK